MMIDERPGVSYPDFTEGSDGFVYCIYDHERLERGEILLARFTEEDVAAGSFVTPGGFTRGVVSAFPAKNNGFFRTAQEIRTIRGYIVYNHGK